MEPQSEDNPYRAPRPEPDQWPESWAPPTVDTSRAICVSGPYTWKHCFAAAKLIVSWRNWWRFSLAVAAALSGLKMAYSLLVLGQPWHWTRGIEVVLTLMSAPVVFFIIAYAIRPFAAIALWRIATTARQRNWVTADAVRSDCPGCSMTYAWDYFDKALVSDDVVVLRTGERLYGILILPRSHFPSDEDWETFVAWVQRKVP